MTKIEYSISLNHCTAGNSKAKATLAISSNSHINSNLQVKNSKTGEETEKVDSTEHWVWAQLLLHAEADCFQQTVMLPSSVQHFLLGITPN